MIKAIIFDFDGVITESTDIKTEAFRELFSDYPDRVDEIVDYHLSNMGISRYIKFGYIYEHFLHKDLSHDTASALGKRFSRIVVEKIISAPFVAGAKEFLDRNRKRYEFFIASGTPANELENIVFQKGLRSYFREINGSPQEKKDIIGNTINRYKLQQDEVVFVGDAQSDRAAAAQTGVVFIERNSTKDSISEKNVWRISDLNDLEIILEKIETINCIRRA